MDLYYILALALASGYVAENAATQPCCLEKTVGGVNYTLLSQGDTASYGCRENCIYQADGKEGSRFCFKAGEKEVTCHNGGYMSIEKTTPMIRLFGGGSIYNETSLKQFDIIKQISDSKVSSLTIVWVDIMEDGTIQMGEGWPRWMNNTKLIENNAYVGRENWPKELESINVKEIMFSVLDFTHIQKLLSSTKGKLTLKNSFAALKQAFPVISGFDLDYEGNQTPETKQMVVDFSSILHGIGFSQVTFNVYYGKPFWIDALTMLNNMHPGFVTGFNLQTYDGGYGQNPCDWIKALSDAMGPKFDASNFVFPGFAVKALHLYFSGCECPDEIKANVITWRKQCGLNVGWIWRLEEIILPKTENPTDYCNQNSLPSLADYTNAIVDGLSVN